MTKMLLAVGAGGALGAMARYLLSGVAMRVMGAGFPWGTLAVNIIGAFAIGIIAELLALKVQAAAPWRAFWVVGLLGGFTTFSAFSLEVGLFIERHEWAMAAGYALISVVLCVLALFAGLALIRATAGG